MKIVFDTNVLVSGLLSPYGLPSELVRLVAAGDLALCYDLRILTEYKEVLLRSKFSFSPEDIHIFMEQVVSGGELVSTKPLPFRLPDPGDEVFLEAALAGNVPFLVTGNIKHFHTKEKIPVQVVLPAAFLAKYMK